MQPGSTEEDRVLLERVKARDQLAMAEVFDRYSELAYSVALRVLKNSAQAEDVIQEVFFHIWKSPLSFASERGSLAAWLAVVTRNRAIDVLRREKRADPIQEITLTNSTDIEVQIERATMIERVRAVLQGLPEEQRTSLELAFFDGLTHAEIADRFGAPLGTIKTRIRTALISLRKAFGS